MQTLQKMLRKDLTHQTMQWQTDINSEKQKSYWIDKDKLGGSVTKKVVALRPKICSYLTNHSYGDIKGKGCKKRYLKIIKTVQKIIKKC